MTDQARTSRIWLNLEVESAICQPEHQSRCHGQSSPMQRSAYCCAGLAGNRVCNFQHTFDPSSTTISVEADEYLFEGFFDSCRREEATLKANNTLHTTLDAYPRFRFKLARLIHRYKYMEQGTVIYKSDDGLSVLMVMKGFRQRADGLTIVEVQFLCMTEFSCPEECMDEICALMPATGPAALYKVEVGYSEIQIVKEVLLANSAMLASDYKRRCKRDWGIEGKAYDVSFFADIGYCQQLPKFPIYCSNGESRGIAAGSVSSSTGQSTSRSVSNLKKAHLCKPCAEGWMQ
ncbi:hypothetical protein WJX73_006022 [Symbiochloris irregularis]|uniref:Uncharacterized protein n=1 Tax=Symbiochloris irregularis TaxID=706552 RepID=A0AAW1NN65_9CHLO